MCQKNDRQLASHHHLLWPQAAGGSSSDGARAASGQNGREQGAAAKVFRVLLVTEGAQTISQGCWLLPEGEEPAAAAPARSSDAAV